MAKEKAKQPDIKAEEAPAAPPKKKKRLLLIIIIVLLLAGGGAAAWYFMQPAPHQDTQAEKPQPKPKPPIFERLENFTVNLAGGEQYLQVEISLKVSDPKFGEEIKLYMPEIRDSVLRLLSSKHANELATLEGKTKLSNEIRTQINKPLKPEGPNEGVLGVFFTSFVIQ